ncbi:hypothetical protein Asi02nite_59790 [Asanoa siamensis]|uniref:Uncharacterized protein n=1 Tax=Asanoa siamensis TaxID=926357 RepID=A0ABQ4CYX6_9ACTN|nr:hypothetical protein Asi02nite_59790 [Asanoa siamensis]
MSHDRVARLLDQIPWDMRRPRLPELPTLARRGRVRRNAALAAVVTLILLTGPALWYAFTLDGRQRRMTAGSNRPTTTARAALTLWMARVDRNGIRITLFCRGRSTVLLARAL